MEYSHISIKIVAPTLSFGYQPKQIFKANKGLQNIYIDKSLNRAIQLGNTLCTISTAKQCVLTISYSKALFVLQCLQLCISLSDSPERILNRLLNTNSSFNQKGKDEENKCGEGRNKKKGGERSLDCTDILPGQLHSFANLSSHGHTVPSPENSFISQNFCCVALDKTNLLSKWQQLLLFIGTATEIMKEQQ